MYWILQGQDEDDTGKDDDIRVLYEGLNTETNKIKSKTLV